MTSEDEVVELTPPQVLVIMLDNALRNQATRLERMNRGIRRNIEEFEIAKKEFDYDLQQLNEIKKRLGVE